MKTFRRISAIVLASVLAFSATAMATQRLAPQTAAEESTIVQAVQANLVAEGYTLDNVQEQPHIYAYPPKAPFDWGHLVYSYSRPGTSLQLPRQEMQITVLVRYLANGVAIPEMTVHEVLAE